jgi:hypothetical protein
MSGLGMQLGLARWARAGTAGVSPPDPDIIDMSGQNWTPAELDAYLIELSLDLPAVVGKSLKLPTVNRTAASTDAYLLLKETMDDIEWEGDVV